VTRDVGHAHDVYAGPINGSSYTATVSTTANKGSARRAFAALRQTPATPTRAQAARRRAGGPGVGVTRLKTISAAGGEPPAVGGVALGARCWAPRRYIRLCPPALPPFRWLTSRARRSRRYKHAGFGYRTCWAQRNIAFTLPIELPQLGQLLWQAPRWRLARAAFGADGHETWLVLPPARAVRAPGTRFRRSTSRRGGRCSLSFRAAIAVFFTFSFLALSAIGAAPQVRRVRHSVAGPSGTRKYEKGRARVRFARVLTPPPPVCVLGSSCCSRRRRVLGDAPPLRRHSLWFGECGVCPSTQVDGCYARSWVTLARLRPFVWAASACVPGWSWHLGNTPPRSTV